ncbi:hypothetical protein [Paenibacillus tyrfis]|uniref:hypothetical protein n=1 Tax=Paenibacillus tyrfis TaxID=1501230 RepID=UPI00209CACE9|nr:hypothetical protein [Paenibacillus tyrfis]MCP1307783.1 hypothetical protein [Paenibacillus tyrfis]
MSSDKTKRLGLNKWVGSDQVLRAEFNENFDKIDAYVNDSLAVKTTSVQLKQGLQVIDVNQSSPLNNVTIQGRTLVNLLGRTGGFEASDIAQWLKGAATLTSDTSTFVSGKSSGKMTITEAKVCFIAQRFTFKKGKYYILIAETKNGTAETGVRIGNNDFFSAWNTDATKWTTQFVKVNYEKDDREDYVIFNCSGAAGQTGYVDNYRVYEITRAEYEAIDRMTLDQVSAKWPYVDDMKSVYSPYIVKYGENLLPPFTEWTRVTAASKATSTDPYKITFFANGDGDFAAYNFRCVPNTAYTLKVDSLDNMYHGISKVNWSEAIVSYTTETSFTFNSGNNTELSYVVKAQDKSKIGSLTNPTLCLGAEAKSFKPCNDDYLFFPNVNLASTVDGTVYDTLFQRDGKYWKQTRFKSMDLKGDLNWIRNGSWTGFKEAAILNFDTGAVGNSETVVKFDGKIIHTSIDTNNDTSNLQTTGHLLIRIPNADSGWGDAFTNLSNDEIKAYFYGWVMYDASNYPQPYNGSGTKAWGYRDPYGAGGLTGGTSTPPNFPAPGFTPYKLQYQLAAPIVEEVASEGGITLREGLNQVEVGTGMIVREKANPQINTGLGYAAINVKGSPNYSDLGALNKRNSKILVIFKNSRIDGNWTQKAGGGNGNYYVDTPIANFDPAAAYTVTYLALDQYTLSCNIPSLEATHPSNMKSAVDTLAAGQSDMAARVGALEITRAQRVQPQWIKPTLLNGWVNYGDGAYTDAGYFKDEFGIVHIRGLVKNGQLNASIFMLPLGYRPARAMVIPVATDGNGQLILGRLTIDFNGSVYHTLGGTGWFSLDGISFLSER